MVFVVIVHTILCALLALLLSLSLLCVDLKLKALVDDGLISEYIFVHIPETTTDMQGTEQVCLLGLEFSGRKDFFPLSGAFDSYLTSFMSTISPGYTVTCLCCRLAKQ